MTDYIILQQFNNIEPYLEKHSAQTIEDVIEHYKNTDDEFHHDHTITIYEFNTLRFVAVMWYDSDIDGNRYWMYKSK